jgi:hypothetical protein
LYDYGAGLLFLVLVAEPPFEVIGDKGGEIGKKWDEFWWNFTAHPFNSPDNYKTIRGSLYVCHFEIKGKTGRALSQRG